MEPNVLVIEDHGVPWRLDAPRWFLDQAVARVLDQAVDGHDCD